MREALNSNPSQSGEIAPTLRHKVLVARGEVPDEEAVIISARGEVLEDHLDEEEHGAIRGNQGQSYLRIISTKKSIVNVSVASSTNFAYLRGGRRGEHLHAAGSRRWARGSAEFGTAHSATVVSDWLA